MDAASSYALCVMCIRFIRLIELALCANRVSMLAVWHRDGVCASVQSALKPLILRLRLSQWANCTKTASRKTYTTLCCVVQYMYIVYRRRTVICATERAQDEDDDDDAAAMLRGKTMRGL